MATVVETLVYAREVSQHEYAHLHPTHDLWVVSMTPDHQRDVPCVTRHGVELLVHGEATLEPGKAYMLSIRALTPAEASAEEDRLARERMSKA
jgi:hypothetical protein